MHSPPRKPPGIRRWVEDEDAMQTLTAVVVLLAIVAAVGGATLLIVLTTDLRDHSSERVQSATDANDVPFEIEQAVVRHDGTWRLTQFVQLPTGADRLDLRNVTITLAAGGDTAEYVYGSGPETGAGIFTATANRDKDGSFSAAAPIMGPGDLIEITMVLTDPQGQATWIQEQSLPNGRERDDRFQAPRLDPNNVIELAIAG